MQYSSHGIIYFGLLIQSGAKLQSECLTSWRHFDLLFDRFQRFWKTYNINYFIMLLLDDKAISNSAFKWMVIIWGLYSHWK